MDTSLQNLLEGVVAYVEVRSSYDNRSSAICHMLEQLGAQVVPSFTDDVTHVVFKEGLKRTWNKAMRKNVPMVSVSWLESCKNNQTRVPEQDFPAILPVEDNNSPLFKKQGVRWKKMKSMQPSDFDEELARSAERGEKRRKRLMLANRFKVTEESTPTNSPVPILALETQARSPLVSALARSHSEFIPDTPPSMKERLERMRREQREALGLDEESPTGPPKGEDDMPLQKRLLDKFRLDFANTDDSSDDEDRSQAMSKLIKTLESPVQHPKVQETKKNPPFLLGVSPLVKDNGNTLDTPKTKTSHGMNGGLPNVASCLFNKKSEISEANLESTETSGEKIKDTKSQRKSLSTVGNRRKSVRLGSGKVDEDNLQKNVKAVDSLDKHKKSSSLIPVSSTNALKENQSSSSVISTSKKSPGNSTSPLSDSSNTSSSPATNLSDESENRPAKTNAPTNSPPRPPDQKDLNFTKSVKKKKHLFSEPARTSSLFNIMTDDSQEDPSSTRPGIDDIKQSSDLVKTGRGKKRDSGVAFLFNNTEPKNEENIANRRKSRRLSSLSSKSGSITNDQDDIVSETSSDTNKLAKLPSSCSSENADNSNCSTSETSMSVMYENDANLTKVERLTYSRRSIDEFSGKLQPTKKYKTKKRQQSLADICEEANVVPVKSKKTVSKNSEVEAKSVNSNTGQKKSNKTSRKSAVSEMTDINSENKKKLSGNTSSSEGASSLNRSADSIEEQQAPKQLRHARSLVFGQSKPNGNGCYSLVLTSLHREEQEVMYSVVKKLKVFYMTNDVDVSTTHVVCGEPRRTLNVLRAIAQGCWLLKKDWVLRSLEENEWLLEEDFELEDFPSAKESRLARQRHGSGYKVDLFSKIGPFFVSTFCTPPRKDIVKLITLCSGQITLYEHRAQTVIGDKNVFDKQTVKPTWVLDSIMRLKCLPVNGYVLENVPQSQRESSPEF